MPVLERNLAKWAIPDEIRFCDAIPINGTGKVDKNQLRQQIFGREQVMAKIDG